MKLKLLLLFCWVLLMAVTAMAAGGDSEARKLDQTPTWAVAGVCAVIIIISIVLEKVLHKLGTVCIFFTPFLTFCPFSLSCFSLFFLTVGVASFKVGIGTQDLFSVSESNPKIKIKTIIMIIN